MIITVAFSTLCTAYKLDHYEIGLEKRAAYYSAFANILKAINEMDDATLDLIYDDGEKLYVPDEMISLFGISAEKFHLMTRAAREVRTAIDTMQIFDDYTRETDGGEYTQCAVDAVYQETKREVERRERAFDEEMNLIDRSPDGIRSRYQFMMKTE